MRVGPSFATFSSRNPYLKKRRSPAPIALMIPPSRPRFGAAGRGGGGAGSHGGCGDGGGCHVNTGGSSLGGFVEWISGIGVSAPPPSLGLRGAARAYPPRRMPKHAAQ